MGPNSVPSLGRGTRYLVIAALGAFTYGCRTIIGIIDVPVPVEAGIDGSGEPEEGGSPDGASVSGAADGLADTGDESHCEGGSNTCTLGATRCTSDALDTCQIKENGCADWVTVNCGSHQKCSVSDSNAACQCVPSLCLQAGSVCQDELTVATCSVDDKGCAFVSATSGCTGVQACGGLPPHASCSTQWCNDCTQGQTSCEPSGLASCTRATNGCLAYGTPAACAAHQTCTGPSGTAACTCATDPICTSVAPTCASESILAHCAQDSQNCFFVAASTTCSSGAPYCLKGACVPCVPPQVQCDVQAASNGVQACGADGQWAMAVQACDPTTPSCDHGACGQPPSCQTSGPGTTNCGANQAESCCLSIEVPGGTYSRTYTNDGTGAIGLADSATVSGFRMDKYLVTVGRFRAFVAAWNAGFRPLLGSGKHTHLNGGLGVNDAVVPGAHEPGWGPSDSAQVAPTDINLGDNDASTWTPSPGPNENRPINDINWYEAAAFCIWDRGFLPTEAELEYAAAGGDEQRAYPWGATPPGPTDDYAIYNCQYPPGSMAVSGACTGAVHAAPVGSATMGAGRWGQLDLVGNEWEPALDWLAPYTPCTDCAFTSVPPAPPTRVLRGGNFRYPVTRLNPWIRASADPTTHAGGYGIRCIRAP